MKINYFRAEAVHGHLDFNIEFFPTLTFLVGINGSGKTSALKLILGLTSPSFNYLNQIRFRHCSVICSSNDSERDIVIHAAQDDDMFSLVFTKGDEHFSSGPIKRFSKSDALQQYDNDDIDYLERRHREEFDQLDISKKIRALNTPKFLGLDRRIYEGVNSEMTFRRQRYGRQLQTKNDALQNMQAIDVSLEEVQILVFDYIRQIPEKQFRISDDFKEKLFREYFKFYDQFDYSFPTSDALADKKNQILAAVSDLGISNLTFSINTFFKQADEIAKRFETRSFTKRDYSDADRENLTKWYINGNQLKRIDEIISSSQNYQQRIMDLKSPLAKLEKLTSNFLREGTKALTIENDGQIKIKLPNGRYANIFELSSGEKQIIIMIAHLIFEEARRGPGVFIIDEPELSLHIAWQEIFIDAITQASPATQFILATHSPAIISKMENERYCQDLSKMNY